MTQTIGVMQGRLLPWYRGRYQSFPKGYWQAEFHVAKQLGVGRIEFILDFEDAELNPLMSEQGIAEIKDVCLESGVKVETICADYFMAAPFHHATHQKTSEQVCGRLIKQGAKLGVTDITIPCVDQSSLKSEGDFKSFKDSLQRMMPVAADHGIRLNLETDLSPKDFRKLVDELDNERVIRVNYDIGNSAALGYNPEEEFAAYGSRISVLHIKDRVLGGKSVPLGTGNAKIGRVMELVRSHDLRPIVIMQAARHQDYLEDLQLFKTQLAYVKQILE